MIHVIATQEIFRMPSFGEKKQHMKMCVICHYISKKHEQVAEVQRGICTTQMVGHCVMKT